MKNKITTLCIDGNYFIYSRLHILPKPKKKGFLIDGKRISTKLMDSQNEMNIFMRKLATDFASEMRKFIGFIDRVVFVVDSNSWRKDYDDLYKANRSYDDNINWDNVHLIMRNFEDILEDSGVIVEKVVGAEGDDMIFAWSTYLNSLGENCIIWSGDKDLMQLVNYNNATSSFSIWYDNTRNRVGVYPGFEKWIEIEDEEHTIDIFNITDEDDLMGINKKQMLKDFIYKNKMEVENVFCDEFAFIKILTGDKGDNIDSVVLKPSKKGDKNFKISEKKALKILNRFKEKNRRFSSTYLFNESYKNDIVRYIKEVMDVNTNDDIILKNLERNTNLILLHVQTIPEAIQKSMFDIIKEDYNRKNCNFTKITSNRNILADTPYEMIDNVKNDFKNIKGLF